MLNNSQYDALMREYQKRQTENRHRQEERVREVYEAVPELAGLEGGLGGISLAHARMLLGRRRRFPGSGNGLRSSKSGGRSCFWREAFHGITWSRFTPAWNAGTRAMRVEESAGA